VPDFVGLEPGEQLETAMLSPVVDGHVRTWTVQGERVWRAVAPDLLAGALGRGFVARTEVEPGRFREVGMLSESGSLLLPSRMMQGQESAGGALFALEPVDRELDADRAWADFAAWLRLVALAAVARGDFLVVETGGWDHQPVPYALFVCVERDGSWLSHLEASPPPLAGTPPWPSPAPDREGATVTALASESAVGVAGYALTAAVSEWARSPLDLAITYGRSPGGPHSLTAPTESAES
jgi:hypothetical protein